MRDPFSRPVRLSPFGSDKEIWIYKGRPPEGARPLGEFSAISAIRRAVGSGERSLSEVHRACERWGSAHMTRTARQIWQEIEDAVRMRRVTVVEIQRETRAFTHYPVEPIAPAPPPVPQEDPELDERSLMISRCDPELGDGPLAFTYLLRGFEGKPCKLRIVSDSFPNQVVHERDLSSDETTDGPHDGEWDGVITSGGAEQGLRLPANYSPARVEIVHDETYRDDAPFTIPKPIRVVHVLECGRVHFDTESAAPPPTVDEQEPGIIEVVRAALRFGTEHPGKQILVAGHTDTAGSDEFNLELSRARARTVHALLSGDGDAWADDCASTATTLDAQRFLSWFAQAYELPLANPGPLDNTVGPKTKAASEFFREQFNLMFGGKLDVDRSGFSRPDWLAVFEVYSDFLAVSLDIPEDDLPGMRADLEWVSPPTCGYGESWPLESIAVDSYPSRNNRRVDVLFFDEHEVPAFDDDESPGESLYGKRGYRAIPIDCDTEPDLDGRYFFSI